MGRHMLNNQIASSVKDYNDGKEPILETNNDSTLLQLLTWVYPLNGGWQWLGNLYEGAA